MHIKSFITEKVLPLYENYKFIESDKKHSSQVSLVLEMLEKSKVSIKSDEPVKVVEKWLQRGIAKRTATYILAYEENIDSDLDLLSFFRTDDKPYATQIC